MKIYIIVFIIAYLIALVSYFFSETSGNFKRRAINKILMATMFIGYATVEMFHFSQWGDKLTVEALIGMFFAYIGDILLLWSFSKGGIAFGIGNVILFCYMVKYLIANGVAFSSFWWFLIIYAVLVGTFCILWFKGWYDYKEKPAMKPVFPLYIGTVSLHGTISIAALALLPFSPRVALFCAGMILYMISDYFISLHKFKFKESKAILRLNSGTYFLGLMLAAVSFSF